MPDDKNFVTLKKENMPDFKIGDQVKATLANLWKEGQKEVTVSKPTPKIQDLPPPVSVLSPADFKFSKISKPKKMSLEDLSLPATWLDEFLAQNTKIASSDYLQISTSHPTKHAYFGTLEKFNDKELPPIEDFFIKVEKITSKPVVPKDDDVKITVKKKSPKSTAIGTRTKPPQIAPSKAIPDFSWNGAIENVVFVTDTLPSDYLGGDGRLKVDLGARLAKAMNVKPHYTTVYGIGEACAEHNNALFISINEDVSWGALYSRYGQFPHFSLAISNDLDGYSRSRETDFRFEPIFNSTAYQHSPKQRAFTIDILPSRITPEIIAEAAASEDRLRSDGKPLIALMLRAQGDEQIERVSRIAKSLADRHGARFVLCAGPATNGDTSYEAKRHFQDISGTIIYPWGGSYNPYLAILGAATHFINTGTLSTTSDLIATGKPVYYTEDNVSSMHGRIAETSNGHLRAHLFKDHAVQEFSEQMLDIAPPALSIRERYAREWDRVGAEFADIITKILVERFAPNSPKFEPDVARKRVACG